MNRIAWVWVALMGLTGCAMLGSPPPPQLRTDYLYEVPDAPEARLCVSSCDKNRERCEGGAKQGAQDQHRLCEDQAQDEYENCMMRTTSFSEKRQCYRKSCAVSADYMNCEVRYRGCFEECGGRVWTRETCEANC